VKETGMRVLYRVTPVFSGDNLLADGVLLEAWSVEDGGESLSFCVYCYNVQPYVDIDYATGASALAGNVIPKVENGIYRTATGKKYHLDPECGGKKIDRNELTVDCFANWIDWANDKDIALDFNPSYFSHPLAADGTTLSHPDAAVRKFWVEHGIACRKIAAEMGKRLGKTCVTNHWCPDGSKDTPFDRLAPRERLMESLDKVFAEKIDKKYNLDAVESKLFGIGAESFTAGSHEFYMGYAIKNDLLLCLDAGHFHPTEVISDKISSALLFLDDILLHVSRGVRWDSDHVVTHTDELQAIADEIIRHNYDKRVHIGLDYFDGSINRIAAWVIGARNMQKALLRALLEPAGLIAEAENSGNYAKRLALMEESRSLPFNAIWNAYCERFNVPGIEWISAVEKYENDVLSLRK
jgi:L-rhamnose isomerase